MADEHGARKHEAFIVFDGYFRQVDDEFYETMVANFSMNNDPYDPLETHEIPPGGTEPGDNQGD